MWQQWRNVDIPGGQLCWGLADRSDQQTSAESGGRAAGLFDLSAACSRRLDRLRRLLLRAPGNWRRLASSTARSLLWDSNVSPLFSGLQSDRSALSTCERRGQQVHRCAEPHPPGHAFRAQDLHDDLPGNSALPLHRVPVAHSELDSSRLRKVRDATSFFTLFFLSWFTNWHACYVAIGANFILSNLI